MEELIIKYLNKNLNENEEVQLKVWLQEDKNNRQIFEHIVAHWQLNQSDLKQSQKRIYHQIINQPAIRYSNKKAPFNPWNYWYKIAAIILIPIAAIFVFYNFQQNEQQPEAQVITHIEKQALPGQKLSFTLPDGSLVQLNADSRLVIPQQFEDNIRQVFLEGEAFFEVDEDASRPFIVATKNFNVKVLGTSFNVRSYQNEDNNSVAVVTGKVMVTNALENQSKEEQLLIPDQMLVYSTKSNSWTMQKGFNEDLIMGWKDRLLSFEDDHINTILNTLSRWYGVEFIVNNEIDTAREFSARFTNPTLKEVMESLSYNYQFNYEINEEKVIIQK